MSTNSRSLRKGRGKWSLYPEKPKREARMPLIFLFDIGEKKKGEIRSEYRSSNPRREKRKKKKGNVSGGKALRRILPFFLSLSRARGIRRAGRRSLFLSSQGERGEGERKSGWKEKKKG